MIELFCLMCGHVWYDPNNDHCPECGCKDFLVNDDVGFTDDRNLDDGYFEGDFQPNPPNKDLE